MNEVNGEVLGDGSSDINGQRVDNFIVNCNIGGNKFLEFGECRKTGEVGRG